MTSQNRPVSVSTRSTRERDGTRAHDTRADDSRTQDTGGLEEVMAGARVVVGIVAASLAQVDERISLPQLRVLAVTADRGVLTVNDVAEVLGVHASNATRLVDRLERHGWIERRADPGNRRQRQLTLTVSGRALVASVMDHRRAAFKRVLDRLSPRARGDVVRAMRALAANSSLGTDADTWVVPTGPRRT
jgi:DNA-binding MarR family transcriptional regulator